MPGPGEIAFEAYGVPVIVRADSQELLPHIERVLPPGVRMIEPAQDAESFVLTTRDGVSYRVEHQKEIVSGSSDLNVAIEVLESQLRSYVALRAPDSIFVHAGTVSYEGRAILVPGRSFSGKTSLVAALVSAGASYYSDEYAVLDEQGLVHPYPKPLSLRNGSLSQTDHHIESLGGSAGVEPVPVGLVVVSHYRPGAVWEPRRLSAGEGALSLLANTVVAQDRPAQAMAVIRRAVEEAVVLEGERGEAAAIADQLLATVAT